MTFIGMRMSISDPIIRSHLAKMYNLLKYVGFLFHLDTRCDLKSVKMCF